MIRWHDANETEGYHETDITDTEADVDGTDDLPATSPIRLTSLGSERKSGNFKKTNGLLNGNINALPDRGSFPGKDLATRRSEQAVRGVQVWPGGRNLIRRHRAAVL